MGRELIGSKNDAPRGPELGSSPSSSSSSSWGLAGSRTDSPRGADLESSSSDDEEEEEEEEEEGNYERGDDESVSECRDDRSFSQRGDDDSSSDASLLSLVEDGSGSSSSKARGAQHITKIHVSFGG